MKKILVTGGAGFLGSHLCYSILSLISGSVINLFTGSISLFSETAGPESFSYKHYTFN